MKKFLGAGIGVLVSAAWLAATSGAAIQAPSGDTCAATGTGTAYTLVITVPSGASEQGGFAFGAPGATVTNITSAGTQGAFSTQSLPANTTGAWLLTGPGVVPGSSITANLTTSGPVAGSFTVVPANSARTTYFDQFLCAHPKGTPVPSNKFTVQRGVTYNSATGTWRLSVSIPGRGTLNFVHRTVAAKGTPNPLIKSGKVPAKSAGKFTLALKPTAAGTAALKAKGSIKLNLNIQFSPRGGKPSNKVVALTLKK